MQLLTPFKTSSPHAAKAFQIYPLLSSNSRSSTFILRQSIPSWQRRGSCSPQVVRCQADGEGAAPSQKVKVVGTTEPVSVKATITVQLPTQGPSYNIIDRALDDVGDLFGMSLQLDFVSADPDSKTGLQKRAVTTFAHKGRSPGQGLVSYEAEFTLPSDFGEVGAILVENEHHKEMFVCDIVLDRSDYDEPVKIRCDSWLHSKFDDPDKRIFFTNKSYLPGDTPTGLRRLRQDELNKLRGNSQGQRKKHERIYDYDVYNDLGDPDKSVAMARPVLGGKANPYPRRCRTGRPTTKKDPLSESRSGEVYVPRDEKFSGIKQATFSIKTLRSVIHAILPGLESVLIDPNLQFDSFTDIDLLFNEGMIMPKTEGIQKVIGFLPSLLKRINETAENLLQFELPALHEKDRFAWLRNEEFSRQVLAGLNPVSIELVREFPFVSKLDPEIYGDPESAITKELIEREIRRVMTVEEAIEQKRLFILDYHDLLLPYVHKIREQGNTTCYGSRTLFYRHYDDTLEAIVIELTRPKSKTEPQWKQAFTHCWDATGAWLWRLAKIHVTSHDSGYHQLISHWLRTHCCVEPYIIAANRQLSAMHPIYRLLDPHFRYTMEINALARESLISGGGIIETSFFPGKYSVELSSVAYDKLWRFDTEALPADLVRRGMAEEDPEAEHGVKLIIQDYPYASDGLLLWSAIEQWVKDYVSHYYKDAAAVISDRELQAWWHEVRNKGHADKKDEPWWPKLDSHASLVKTLTTIIWVASCHHAAVNFGQYHYGGYFPNRPTVARKNMPVEDGGEAMKKFLNKPEQTLLESLPSQLQATVVMAILDVLSNHSPDEEYIGKQIDNWSAEPIIKAAYERFAGALQTIEGIIDERNLNLKLKNRSGAGVVPYELLKPTSEPGVTGRGIPNSISI